MPTPTRCITRFRAVTSSLNSCGQLFELCKPLLALETALYRWPLMFVLFCFKTSSTALFFFSSFYFH